MPSILRVLLPSPRRPRALQPPGRDAAAAPADPPQHCPQAVALADLLRAASPEQAYGFALHMHERSCESGDDHCCELWRSVADTLRASRDPRPASGSPGATIRPGA